MTEITREAVAAELQKLADENPGKKAECWYSVEAYEEEQKRNEHYQETGKRDDEPMVHPGETPLCIAGNVIHALTPEVYPLLVERKTVEQEANRGTLKDAGYTDEAIQIMGHAQTLQDLGGEWPKAVESALR